MYENGNSGIRIAALLGSVRPGNYTRHALALAVDELRQQAGLTVEFIDPAGLDLPLPGRPATDDARTVKATVSAATGVILATPEYHGGFSSVMKLLIENMGFPSALAGKPVALLGVAGGRIGAIKSLEQLRSVASHVGGLVLPGPVSVANVRTVFAADGRCLEPAVEERIRGLSRTLLGYIHSAICPRYSLEAMVRG